MSIEARRLARAFDRVVRVDLDSPNRRVAINELVYALDAFADRMALGFTIAVRDLCAELIEAGKEEDVREKGD